MTPMKRSSLYGMGCVTGLVIVLFARSAATAQDSAQYTPQYSNGTHLVLPKDYRQWVFLSSGIGMTYSGTPGENPPFENVFVNAAAHQEFLKTGTWPDKTILLLEIRKSESKVSINKAGRVQSNVQAIEAHVKDSSHSTDSGGWAFYGFPAGGALGRPFEKTADCFSCHQQNGATDTTFVQFYPTLVEAAKAHGTYNETEHK